MAESIPRGPIFLTGAAGFIGANLTRKLVSLRLPIHILIKKSTDLSRLDGIRSSVIVHNTDMRDTSSLTKLLSTIKPKTIFHLATNGAYESQNNPSQIAETNVLGTISLLIASRAIDYDAFVNTGSSSEYGKVTKPMKESYIGNPLSYYGVTKLAATTMCSLFAQQHKKPIITIRPFSVYGPYETNTRFIPTIIRQARNNEPIAITLENARHDFIYIDDMIEILIRGSVRARNLPNGTIINAGTGKEYTNEAVVKLILKLTKSSSPVQRGAFPHRNWDISHWRADTKKMKDLLAYLPSCSLKLGIQKTISHRIKHNQ